jgi:predicted metal-binding membrane protein
MSIGWMAVIAAFIAGEKLLPWPRASRHAVGVALVVLGLALSIVPADVPGFS